MSKIIAEIKSELKNRGYRSSANREAILNVLDKADRPLTVGEIYEHFGRDKKIKDLDQSTAYRIIETLAKEGFVKFISLLEGYNRYELERGDHHHHFVCTNCQDITPIHLDSHLTDSEKQIEKEQDVVITHHSLEFFGICKNCK